MSSLIKCYTYFTTIICLRYLQLALWSKPVHDVLKYYDVLSLNVITHVSVACDK